MEFDLRRWLPYIQQELPQVNETTKIRAIDRMVYHIPILDPIQIRPAYNEPILTRKGAYWRLVGAVFNRPDWSAKGWTYNLPAYYRERKIELRQFVIRGGWPQTHSRLVMGYDPVGDTLYINPAYTVWMEPSEW